MPSFRWDVLFRHGAHEFQRLASARGGCRLELLTAHLGGCGRLGTLGIGRRLSTSSLFVERSHGESSRLVRSRWERHVDTEYRRLDISHHERFSSNSWSEEPRQVNGVGGVFLWDSLPGLKGASYGIPTADFTRVWKGTAVFLF